MQTFLFDVVVVDTHDRGLAFRILHLADTCLFIVLQPKPSFIDMHYTRIYVQNSNTLVTR
jgi:hypothetical protein